MRDNMYAEAWFRLSDILRDMTKNETYLPVERYQAERLLDIMAILIK